MGSVFGIPSSKVEEVPYEVVQRNDKMEIRKYGERMVVETLVLNSNKLTESNGFMTLARYISGRNKAHEKIPMTSPVEVRPNERCVTDGNASVADSLLKTASGMFMRFTLPHKLKEADVPSPLDVNVNVSKVDSQLFATFRFSGAYDEHTFVEHGEHLLRELQGSPYFAVGPVISLRYDPPWTLSCFRRNEVAVEVESRT